MYENVEKKCLKLFGDCPLNMDDFRDAKACNYSEEDLIAEAARKFYMQEDKNFFVALWNWKDGNKLNITREEAKKRNEYVRAAREYVESRNSIAALRPINWEAFPNNDPTICLYMGYPLDCDLCQWASNYKK